MDKHDPLATFGLQGDCPNGIDVLKQYSHFGKALTNYMADHFDCILSQTRGCYISINLPARALETLATFMQPDRPLENVRVADYYQNDMEVSNLFRLYAEA